MLKELFDAGKCLIGVHQGDWALEAHGSCRMLQVCRVCGQETRRVEHLWSPWSADDASGCQSTRSCTRCDEAEARVEHEWSDWTYRGSSSCDQGRHCTRCDTWNDESHIVHAWSGWAYSEAHRAPIRQCTRCRMGVSYFIGEIALPSPSATSRDEFAATRRREDRNDGMTNATHRPRTPSGSEAT